MRELWREDVEGQVKAGKLPLLIYVKEGELDIYRFPHLTFQEFLCSHEVVEQLKGGDVGEDLVAQLVCPRGTEDMLTKRGWWHQVLQMLAEQARAEDAGKEFVEAVCTLAEMVLELWSFELVDVDNRGVPALQTLFTLMPFKRTAKGLCVGWELSLIHI